MAYTLIEAAETIVACLIPSNSDHRPTLDEFMANDEDYLLDGVDSDDLRVVLRAALDEY